MKKILFQFIIIGCILPSIITAQQPTSLGLSVSPQVFEIDVFPGEILNKKIDVGNLSEVALPIAAKLTDFTAKEDTGEMEFDEALQDPSIASRKWFAIENPNFVLDPRGKKEVELTITIPENAEPGGHYSVMLFEPQLPSFYFLEGEPRAIPVVGVLFLLSVKTFSLEPKIEQKLEVVEFSLPKEERILVLENILSKIVGSVAQAAKFTITEKSPSKFILRIKNNDIYHLKPYGKISIYNIFGKEVGETLVPKMTILPGKTRQFPVDFSSEIPENLKWLPALVSNFLTQNFFIGKYQAKLELQPNTPAVLTFFSLPWQFWFSFILISSLTIFFSMKYRKRIILAIKTLFSKS